MVLAALIRLYQRWLTRYTPRCPNVPSCSAYGLRAARLHGSVKGAAMAWRRIHACGAIAYATHATGPGPCDDSPSGPDDGCLE